MSSEQPTTATFSPPLEPTSLTGHKRKADNETLPDASVEEVLVTEVDVQGLTTQALFPPTTSASNYSNHNNGTKQQQYTVSDMLIEYSKIHHTIVEFTHKCQQLYQLYQNSGTASDQQPQQQHHHNTLEMMGYITKMFEVGGQDLLNELSFMHHAYITNNTTAPILNTLSRSSSSNPLSNSTNTSILQNAINSSNSNIVSNRSLNSSSNALSSSLSSLTSSSASAAVANATNSFAGQLALIPTDLDSSTGNLLSSSQNNLNEAGHSVILQGICFEFPAFCCWDDQKNRIVVKREVSDQHSSVTIQAYKTKGIADENTTLYFKDGEEKEQEIKETNNVFVIQVAFTDNTKAGNNKKVIIRRGDATTAQTIPIRALKKSQYNFIRNQTPKKVKEI